MADEAIIEAEYVEWKMVKTRKALQLIFEVPLELQARVQTALGTPLPDVSTPVAIVRMVSEAELVRGIEALAPPPRKAKLAQIAGILCNEGAFQKWSGSASADEAAEWLRGHCNIASRTELDTSEEAAAIFRTIKGDYEYWLNGGDVPAFDPEHQKQARAA